MLTSGHAKVANLHRQVGSDHAVAGGKVTMNESLRGQVRHAVGNLGGNLVQLKGGERLRVGIVLAVGAIAAQVVAKIAQRHNLHQHVARTADRDNAQQLHHVVAVGEGPGHKQNQISSLQTIGNIEAAKLTSSLVPR